MYMKLKRQIMAGCKDAFFRDLHEMSKISLCEKLNRISLDLADRCVETTISFLTISSTRPPDR